MVQLVAIATVMNGLNFSVWIPGILVPVMCVLQTFSVLFYSLGHHYVTAQNIIILLHCAPIFQCNMAHTTLLTCDL